MKTTLTLLCFLLLSCSLFGCSNERTLENDMVHIKMAIKYRRIGIPISSNALQICYRNELYNVEIKPTHENSKDFEVTKIIPVLENIQENVTKIKKCSNITIPNWE